MKKIIIFLTICIIANPLFCMKQKTSPANQLLQKLKVDQLIKAIFRHAYQDVEELLRNKYPINSFNFAGNTPLCAAVFDGDTNAQLVKLLLRNGAHPNFSNVRDATPLHLAASRGHANLVRILLNHGADPCAIDADGITALQYAIHGNHTKIANKLRSAMGISIPWGDWLKVELPKKIWRLCRNAQVDWDDEAAYIG